MGSLSQLAEVRDKLPSGAPTSASNPPKLVTPAAKQSDKQPTAGATNSDETGSIGTTGWVTVSRVPSRPNATSKGVALMFTGLLAPAQTENSDGPVVVNRRLAIDRRVEQRSPWFSKLCRDIVEGDGVMQVRVRIINITKDVGFIAPCARSLDTAKREWRQRVDQKIVDPLSVDVVLTPESTREECALAAYQGFVKKFGGTLVHFNTEDLSAVVIGPKYGQLYQLRNGDNIFNFVTGIIKGATTLEEEAALAVSSSLITSMKMYKEATGAVKH